MQTRSRHRTSFNTQRDIATEYAIVLAQELSTAQFYFDPQDALVELRQTLDDLSKAFAKVWAQ